MMPPCARCSAGAFREQIHRACFQGYRGQEVPDRFTIMGYLRKRESSCAGSCPVAYE